MLGSIVERQTTTVLPPGANEGSGGRITHYLRAHHELQLERKATRESLGSQGSCRADSVRPSSRLPCDDSVLRLCGPLRPSASPRSLRLDGDVEI